MTSVSSEAADMMVSRVLAICGPGKILWAGRGISEYVIASLNKGIDAFGHCISTEEADLGNKLSPGRYSSRAYDEMPFEDGAFSSVVVCVDYWAIAERLDDFFKQLFRITRTNLVMQIFSLHSSIDERTKVESALFRKGFRKHPLYYKFVDYEGLEEKSDHFELAVERISPTILSRFPLDVLAEERSLHMDMSRESGRRSDGHIFRYFLASHYLRPGDTVLDIACGLGYGAHTLSAAGYAARVIGLDSSEYAVNYASESFSKSGVSFQRGDAENLSQFADNSADLITSFETLEHLANPGMFLAEASRILKPSGRIFVSVPNLWIDEATGKDPNPYHFHEYDVQTLRDQISKFFIIERLFAQHAGGGFKFPQLPRLIRSIGRDEEKVDDAEWILCLGMKSPMQEAIPEYQETSYPVPAKSDFIVADFTRHFDNPWLFKAMVSVPWRISDSRRLVEFAYEVVDQSRPASNDAAAAISVIGYDLLSRKSEPEGASLALGARITDWIGIARDREDAATIRWKISLTFLNGLLLQKTGRLNDSKRQFQRVLDYEALKFSPLLATKQVEAAFRLGQSAYQECDHDGARKYWQKGVVVASAALRSSHLNAIGDPSQPLDFGFPELAIVSELGAKCAFGIQSLAYPSAIGFAYDMWREVRIDTCRKQQIEIAELRRVISEQKSTIAVKQSEIDTLVHSRGWQLLERLRSIKKKIFGEV